ncbi:MAG: class I SAM-dependent DNA methyltransferase [Thermincolia bacterium]
MAQYGKLADIYDYLVGSVDYNEWIDYIEAIVRKFGYEVRTVADLACGTGNTTLPFAQRGYRVVGIDLSGEMLDIARQKAEEEGSEAEFLEQNMCELSLPEPVDLITCYHDGLNYILEPEDLDRVFRGVHENLKPGGLFIFDLVNVHKLKRIHGGTTFVDDEKMSLAWETFYHQDRDVWEIQLTGFIKKGDLYEKFQEVHQEKGYSTEEVMVMLAEARLELLDIYEAFSFNKASDSTYRKFYVVRRLFS